METRIRAGTRTWLVTGVAGFIGSHLLETLLRLDQRVIGLDNFSSGRRENLTQVRDAVTAVQWRNFRLVEGDIRSPGSCREACRSAQLVLHQAALASVPRSLEDPLGAHECNVTGFLNILAAARAAGVSRVIYAASSAAYGDSAAEVKVESDVGRPLSPYGLTKRVNEQYAEMFARCYGLASIGLRYFNVFGPRQDPGGDYAAVIPKWITSMIRSEPVYINGDGSTTRDFCHVDNVVQANLCAALVEDPAALDQVYNVALGRSTTLSELFEMIRGLLAPRFAHVRGLRPVHREFRAGDVRASLADIGKAQRLLRYRPVRQLREGLEHTVDWYTTGSALPEPRRRTADTARAGGSLERRL